MYHSGIGSLDRLLTKLLRLYWTLINYQEPQISSLVNHNEIIKHVYGKASVAVVDTLEYHTAEEFRFLGYYAM
jgi:hypothetical protein